MFRNLLISDILDPSSNGTAAMEPAASSWTSGIGALESHEQRCSAGGCLMSVLFQGRIKQIYRETSKCFYKYNAFGLHSIRSNPGSADMAPPSSSAVPPSSLDTLSTLREVNSNPPSPESSSSVVFPRLVVSPPLFSNAAHNGDSFGKHQNGLDHSPTEEPPSMETTR